MGTSLNRMYWTIEVNLIIWLALLGAVAGHVERQFLIWLAVGGFVIAAVLQHWAYHGLRKAGRSGP